MTKTKAEKVIDKAIDNVPENNPDASTEPTRDTGDTKAVESLYQKKVYIVDLNNIGFEIEGEGELIVDVLEIKKNKATIRNGELTIEVPKDFLF